MPEQPPPLTPRRTPLSTLDCDRRESCALICSAAFSVTLMLSSATRCDLLLFGCLDRRRDALLLLPIGDGGLDGVLRQHRAVDLDRRQGELLGDLLVGHRQGFVHRLAL